MNLQQKQLIAAFLIGCLIGAAAGSRLESMALHRFWQHGPDPQHVFNKFNRELSLDASQQESVKKLIEKHHAEMMLLQKETAAKFQAIRLSMRSDVGKVLNAGQKEKFAVMTARWTLIIQCPARNRPRLLDNKALVASDQSRTRGGLMKYLKQIAIMGGLIAALCSAPALHAEDHQDKNAEHPHHGMMADHFKDKLGLSDDQAKKLKDAFKAFRESQEPLHKQFNESMKKLEAQITLKYADSDIQATLDDLSKTHKAMEAAHDKFVSSLSFLTATQRAKLLVGFLKHMHGEGHPMMHGQVHGAWGGEHEHGDHWAGPKGPEQGGDDMRDALDDQPQADTDQDD